MIMYPVHSHVFLVKTCETKVLVVIMMIIWVLVGASAMLIGIGTEGRYKHSVADLF